MKCFTKQYKRIWAVFLTVILFSSPVYGISVSEEKKLAKEFVASIEKTGAVIKDPLANGFIEDLGRCIVANVPPQPFEFNFRIVDEDRFNAFAGPGANIFINRGLFTSLDYIDELAGILAHEVGHAVCRHVSQMIDRSKFVNFGTLAGLLAGILVGVAGGGDAAQGVIMSSAAAGQSSMLAFSRENETEADQKGLKFTCDASFSPKGLLTGLKKIRDNDFYGTDAIPGYLKTHPGTKDRIVFIQRWMEDHYREKKEKPLIDPFRFEVIKYRLTGLYGNRDEAEQKLAAQLKKEPDNGAVHYGMALVLIRKSRFDKALFHLDRAAATRTIAPLIRFEKARIRCMSGEYKKALTIFKELDTVSELAPFVSYYRGIALLETGSAGEAEKHFSRLIAGDDLLFPRAYYHLARISGEKGDQGTCHFYLALYYNEINEMRNCCFHLQQSLKQLDDPEKKARAEALSEKCGKKFTPRTDS
ncbi:MAG: M48 family metalloprotease [Desulfobacteraceae bacterium]